MTIVTSVAARTATPSISVAWVRTTVCADAGVTLASVSKATTIVRFMRLRSSQFLHHRNGIVQLTVAHVRGGAKSQHVAAIIGPDVLLAQRLLSLRGVGGRDGEKPANRVVSGPTGESLKL